MKWAPFIILAILATIAQTMLAPRMAIGHIWPDLMFILALHYAMWGPWPDGAIACWLLGVLLGTQSVDRVGLHALCYGAAAWGIFRCRHAIFREHPGTQFVIAFFFALGVQLAIGIYRAWKVPSGMGGGELISTAFFSALYTAALTPWVDWILARLGRWTGLRAGQKMPRYG